MRIAVDGEWYDLTKWAPHHPGGAKLLETYDNMDATDAFYSLHSSAAINKLRKMAPVEDKQAPPASHPVDKEFRQLRDKLVKDGWFERNLLRELGLLLPVVSMVVFGTLYATTYPILATIAIAVAMQQSGWLGHDFTHARDSSYCDTLLPLIAGWIVGFNRDWWSDKHNTHHVLTNHIEMDPDIDNRPFLFLWAPPKKLDHHLRKYQHYYFPVLYCFLYVSWRLQSLQWAWRNKQYKMLLFTLLPSYIWLASLPVAVSVGSVLLSGFLVAIVVTLSHESETMVTERIPSYVLTQFYGTCEIACPDPLTEYLGGGMQYQLIHHLFPTMPRYNYPAMVPVVRAFAKANNLEYKRLGLQDMLTQHVATLRKHALVASVE